MKTIKIKDIEISAEELRRIVSENKELLKEPEVKGRYFFPKGGESFWHIYGDGSTGLYRNTDGRFNVEISKGVFRTDEEALLSGSKQRAIVACWKWAQENAPFEPDWGNGNQDKWFAYYHHGEKKFCCEFFANSQHQFTLPYFKSIKDTDAFIKACKEHLTLLFTK